MLEARGWKQDARGQGLTADWGQRTDSARNGISAECAEGDRRARRLSQAKTETGSAIKGDTRVFYDKSAEVEENKRFARLLMSVE
jgi:hypothetical protein